MFSFKGDSEWGMVNGWIRNQVLGDQGLGKEKS
jgi:hypothetical protein